MPSQTTDQKAVPYAAVTQQPNQTPKCQKVYSHYKYYSDYHALTAPKALPQATAPP
ncbi:MAG: hypothetical protein IJK36_06765 [Bacteroidales bacterium]|nr:hypothetical protein [Bacteroidales bacterium]